MRIYNRIVWIYSVLFALLCGGVQSAAASFDSLGDARSHVMDVRFISEDDYDFGIVNMAVGAETFYNYGFFGGSATVANVEAYLPDTSNYFFENTNIGGTYVPESALGGTSSHASVVSGVMASFGPIDEDGSISYLYLGIAPTATLYSAAIATEDLGNGYFNTDSYTIFSAYHKYFVETPVDVVNSSWGGNAPAAEDTVARMVDALALKGSNTVFVAAAGNSGADGPGTVGSPATAYNGISVGALDNPHGYDTIADYSSYGPSDFYNPQTGETIKGVRASVDITAPGSYILSADFDTNDPDLLSVNNGTSFASPIVAGVAALLADTSRSLGADDSFRDARLIKAILLNSASKPKDWDNGQRSQDGVEFTQVLSPGITYTQTFDKVIVTTQSLDYRYGAGILDADRAFNDYVFDSGKNGYGTGEIALGEILFISIGIFDAGDILNATLVWFAEVIADFDNPFPDGEDGELNILSEAFSNLDLELWWIEEESGTAVPIAASRSDYDAVEHLSLTLENSGEYYLRILFEEMAYGDLSAEKEFFAIAWSAIPEPAHFAVLLGLAFLSLAALHRKKSRKS